MGGKLTLVKCLLKVARNEYVQGTEDRFGNAPLAEDLMSRALRAQVGFMIPVVADTVRDGVRLEREKGVRPRISFRLGSGYVPRITMANHILAGLGAATGGR